MNPDLAMGDELLKKTGAGNLFMVFGEPDVEISKQKNGQIVAEIKGVDVYDQPPARFAARPPMTSRVGLSTPTTTVKVFSCATPTSPEPTSLMISSKGLYALILTKRHGRASIAR